MEFHSVPSSFITHVGLGMGVRAGAYSGQESGRAGRRTGGYIGGQVDELENLHGLCFAPEHQTNSPRYISTLTSVRPMSPSVLVFLIEPAQTP